MFSMLPKKRDIEHQREDWVAATLHSSVRSGQHRLPACRQGVCRRALDVNYVNSQACYLAGSRVKGHDGKPELQVIISYNQPKDSVETYRRRWQIETMFKAMKSAGFNMEDTHLTDPERVGKLLMMVMMAFVWCYNIGELVHRKIRPIRILKHGRKEKSIIRYGLDIVADYLQRGINEFKIPIFDLFGITNQIFT